MKVSIRKATLDDIPILKVFEQGLISDERPFDATIRPDPVHYYDLKALITDSKTCFLIAFEGDEILASGYATRKIPRPYLDHKAFAYFGFMYTRPEYRGLGINGMIVKALKEWSVDRGLHEMRLTVYPGNQPAIRAYEKVGFTSHLVEMRFREGETDSGK
ncbi:GNAT family N-acetyltransferase [Robiginitalea aurantiaca]|uniref:GNAT family N-acetyltransferase n=1 Tax=Robiginitalea aurantiaca TaxID=3056915 RepID=A0ABT7WHC6_9FLAO|nr:GNAT family N-acetyltransferase [Robiginitalea aurantiaca]MDM9632328.1 GNAT family N-acetyltransferase [Robiginitalea aurantiaca]